MKTTVKRVMVVDNYETCKNKNMFVNVESAIDHIEDEINGEAVGRGTAADRFRASLNKEEVRAILLSSEKTALVELPNGTYYEISWTSVEIDLSEISTEDLEAELKTRAGAFKRSVYSQSFRNYWHEIGNKIELQDGEDYDDFRKRVAKDAYTKSSVASADVDFETWWQEIGKAWNGVELAADAAWYKLPF